MGLARYVEDAAVLPIPQSDMVLVKNLDVFTPIVDDPEIQGEIAACNVTNDIFAMNVPSISGMLIFLAIDTEAPEIVSEGLLKGIKYFMEEKIDSKVVGGHTILCDWPLIGGEASGFVHKDAVIRKRFVTEGDRLVLTKPVGLQAIMAAYRILKDMPELLEQYSRTELSRSIDLGIELMTTPNQNVVKTIHSYQDFSFVHSLSDVTGFGLAGHTKEMLQHSNLSALIEKIPAIKLSEQLSHDLGYAFDECRTHETAGGMLMAVGEANVEDFCNSLTANEIPNWIVGKIDKHSPGEVRVSPEVEILEVEHL